MLKRILSTSSMILSNLFASNNLEASLIPSYNATKSAIPISIAKQMRQYTWRPDCPVALKDLSYLRMSIWGFDHAPHEGELIVHKNVADEVIAIFKQLYEQRFPIERMQLMEVFQGDDEAAMSVNNTSAFNCRMITNKPGQFSLHSYGVAIDINPLLNPYVKGAQVLPQAGQVYTDRSKVVPGMIVRHGLVYNLFVAQGWQWGGDWQTRQDYQHFEKPAVVHQAGGAR